MFGLTRERLAVTLTLGLFLTGSVGLVVPSLILPSGFASEGALGLPGAPHAMAAAPAAVTHGDLVVGPTNSPYVIQAIPSGGTYFEEGNVTVLAGGTLLVENTTFDMLQFVGNSGTVANRLSHLYAISIQGVAIFSHSTITSDTTILNAYVKVPVTVSGAGSLIVRDGSQVAFPGWVTVVGAGASLYVNDSFVMGNPAAAGLPDGPTIGNDTLYAPSLNITGGAHAFFGGSAVVDTYHDNPSASGWPGAVLVNRTQEGLSASAPGHWANFVLAGTGALGIAQADLYPSVASGYVSFNFTTSFATSSTASFANSGTTYALGSVLFTSTSTVVTAALPAAAIHQINTMGIPAFLQATGEFGTGGALFVNLTAPSFQVNVTSVTLQLVPALGYDLSVSGGSTLTAVDTLLGINFNQTVPASGSNKLVLETGSHAFLANVSTTGVVPSGFGNTSAVLPDATSNATFYRWLAVPVMVAPGAPIPGGVATAFYSLDTSQTNNASASYYNTLAPAPGLATWVDQVDAGRGVTAYGTSSSSGFANLLVASTLLSQNDLPDGNYLGEYHVAVNVVGGGTVWQDAGVSPYPTNMTPAGPDLASAAFYPNFHAILGASAVTVQIGSTPVANDTVAIGQKLNLSFTITNSGPAPATSYSASLWFLGPQNTSPVPVGKPLTGGSLGAGQSAPANLSWVVNEAVTGTIGQFVANFTIQVIWDNGVAPLGGVGTSSQAVTIVPAYIAINYAPIGAILNATTDYDTVGTIQFAGNGVATIWINATSGAYQTPYAQTATKAGVFHIVLGELPGMPSGTYAFNITVSYNHRTVSQVFGDVFVIPAPPPPPSGINILFEQFFGFPLWEILAIVGAVALGAVGVLMFARSSARGRLVECGECGELIPENATACPKCGAEFESDLVRCSRCGSTIPARSATCPECAATLLGKEESAARDPDRQGYADYVERYRLEARKELGENYSESAFWDWWKRQQSYVPFSQWKLQQAQGSRLGMSAPPAMSPAQEEAPPMARRAPPPAAAPRAAAPAAAAPPRYTPAPPAPAAAGPPAAGGAGMKACPNCGKEVPPDFLVCPFCGAVTR